MSWTIGYKKQRHEELVDCLLLCYGKALCIASTFEQKCKYLAEMYKLTNALKDGKDFDAAAELVRAMKERRLVDWVKLISSSPVREAEVFETLDRAREARNYIAHESAVMDLSGDARGEYLLKRFADLEPHVVAIAAGDNIVSRWEYEFCEREPAPSFIYRDYPTVVNQWVFQGTPLDPQVEWAIPEDEPRGTEGLLRIINGEANTQPATRRTLREV